MQDVLLVRKDVHLALYCRRTDALQGDDLHSFFFFNFSQVKLKNSEENGSKTTTNMRIPGSVDFLNLCVSKEKISKFSSIAKKKKRN